MTATVDEGGDAEPCGEDGVVHSKVCERVLEWFVGLFPEQDVVGLERQDQDPDGCSLGRVLPDQRPRPNIRASHAGCLFIDLSRHTAA